MKLHHLFLIVLFIILGDQALKIWVHYNMEFGSKGEINMLWDKFRLHFLLNDGMAFGIEFNWRFGKLFLTLFRVVSVFVIAWFIVKQFHAKAHKGFLICLAMILGGALGNTIDSVFYGVLFGYTTPFAFTPWFHGQVIDMLYFPMIQGTYPEWVPRVGGDRFLFFSPVFNVADSFVTMGLFSILIFYRKFFNEEENNGRQESALAVANSEEE